MKIQIDTQAKTIKLEQSAKLSELYDILEKFLPNGEWKEYQLETNTIIYNWYNPIVWPYNHNPYSPYGGVIYLTGNSGTTANVFPDKITTDTVTIQANPHLLNIETN